MRRAGGAGQRSCLAEAGGGAAVGRQIGPQCWRTVGAGVLRLTKLRLRQFQKVFFPYTGGWSHLREGILPNTDTGGEK